MKPLRWLVAATAVVLATSCSNTTSPEDLYGVWGSTEDGVSLTISISGSTFAAPCYMGTPSTPFLTESGGNFHTNGLLTMLSGAGGPSTTRNVDYKGTLHGSQMTLTVDPGAQQLGPYTLTRDVQVQVPGCP